MYCTKLAAVWNKKGRGHSQRTSEMADKIRRMKMIRNWIRAVLFCFFCRVFDPIRTDVVGSVTNFCQTRRKSWSRRLDGVYRKGEQKQEHKREIVLVPSVLLTGQQIKQTAKACCVVNGFETRDGPPFMFLFFVPIRSCVMRNKCLDDPIVTLFHVICRWIQLSLIDVMLWAPWEPSSCETGRPVHCNTMVPWVYRIIHFPTQ